MIVRFAAKGKSLSEPAPRSAAYHWRRFRRLMMFMFGIAVVAVAAALWLLHRDGVVLRLHFMIALGLGITLSLLLAGALMGLVFMSANSGHDDTVLDLPQPDRDARGND